MTVNKQDVLLDAIAFVNESYKADTLSYKLRNPLLLKSYSRPGRHEIDENGLRVFDSFEAAYKACSYDIDLKLKGLSNCGLKPEDKLRNLLAVYGLKDEQKIMSVVFFLRKALAVKDIDQTTPLSYFTE